MVFIPQGSFVMGPSDQDVPFSKCFNQPEGFCRKVFYMDETEITNNEYRQFERWVVDSMIRTEMKLFKIVGETLC